MKWHEMSDQVKIKLEYEKNSTSTINALKPMNETVEWMHCNKQKINLFIEKL